MSKNQISSFHSLAINSTSSRTRSINSPDSQSNNEYNEINFGRYTGVKQQSVFNISSKQVVSFGLDYEYEDFKNSNLSFSSIQNEWSAGVFTSYKQVFDTLSVFANIRGDIIQDETVLTGKINLSANLPNLGKISLAYATGYKAPSLYERYGQFGNPRLISERADSVEVNLKIKVPRGFIALGAYSTNLSDEIRFLNSQFQNSGNFKNEGLDLEIDQRISENFEVGTNIGLLDSKDKITGRQALRRPFTQASLNLKYEFSTDLRALLNTVYIGRRRDVDYLSFNEKDLKSINSMIKIGYDF